MKRLLGMLQNTTTAAVRFAGVDKTYGATPALVDLSIEFPYGQISGIIGHNGAGKSTLLKLCAGLISPTAGHIYLGGYDVDVSPIDAKRQLGFVPETPSLYDLLTPLEHLELVANLHEIDRVAAARRQTELLEQFGLNQVAAVSIGTLSKGMRQRLMIVSALLPEPQILLLDEPLDGLDPTAAEMVQQLLRDHAARGGAVLMASHSLDVVLRLCDSVTLIKSGRAAIASGRPQDVITGDGGFR